MVSKRVQDFKQTFSKIYIKLFVPAILHFQYITKFVTGTSD